MLNGLKALMLASTILSWNTQDWSGGTSNSNNTYEPAYWTQHYDNLSYVGHTEHVETVLGTIDSFDFDKVVSNADGNGNDQSSGWNNKSADDHIHVDAIASVLGKGVEVVIDHSDNLSGNWTYGGSEKGSSPEATNEKGGGAMPAPVASGSWDQFSSSHSDTLDFSGIAGNVHVDLASTASGWDSSWQNGAGAGGGGSHNEYYSHQDAQGRGAPPAFLTGDGGPIHITGLDLVHHDYMLG
jgi:hypothetical protein